MLTALLLGGGGLILGFISGRATRRRFKALPSGPPPGFSPHQFADQLEEHAKILMKHAECHVESGDAKKHMGDLKHAEHLMLRARQLREGEDCLLLDP